MDIGDLLLTLAMAAVIIFAARNLFNGFRRGRIDLPGARQSDRTARPSQYWLGILFEMAIILVFGVMLARHLSG
jgi:hypothetical protein